MVWVNNPSVTKTTIYSDTSSDLIDEIKSQFGKLIEKYKVQLPESQIDYVIREGKVYREMLDEAREIGESLHCLWVRMALQDLNNSGLEAMPTA